MDTEGRSKGTTFGPGSTSDAHEGSEETLPDEHVAPKEKLDLTEVGDTSSPVGGNASFMLWEPSRQAPASSVSVEQFLEGLASVAVLSSTELDQVRRDLTSDAMDPTQSLSTLASTLVDRGALTDFQASALLEGGHSGLILGHHVLIGKLGQGGMGIVYEAIDRERNTIVALKVLPNVDASSLYRFKREFRAHTNLSHPNLIKLYELFSHEDRWYYTMERVVGIPFLDAIRNGLGECEGRTRDDPSRPPPSNEPDTVLWSRADNRSRPEPRSGRRVADLELTRDLFRQLVDGLNTIHDAGLLHRDIKPSNVMVRPNGQVAILDFGLVADLDPELADDVGIVGTIEYMSPEQASGGSLTPASDFYSAGVMLYEALVGRKPFAGSSRQLLKDKQQFDPPAPIDCVPDLPRDLNDLCVALLDRRPEARPSGAEVLERLGRAERVGGFAVPVPSRSTVALGFVGRHDELAILAEAYQSILAGGTAAVFLTGPSGSGKTSLIAQFLRGVPPVDAPVVLTGRCFEQESVPFKAIDNLVDELARYLRRLPHEEAVALLPTSAAELARLFPILHRVEAIAQLPSTGPAVLNRKEMRRRAFAGFRELLERVGRTRPLVLAIDDLQWGDVDSASLLTELLLPPNPPRLLLLCVCRSEFAESGACLKSLRSGLRDRETFCKWYDLRVDALTLEESRKLATLALHAEGVEPSLDVEAIVRESGGNPYFVVELARHVREDRGVLAPGSRAGPIHLDGLLQARVERLPDQARRLLNVVALAGQPISQRLRVSGGGASGERLARPDGPARGEARQEQRLAAR